MSVAADEKEVLIFQKHWLTSLLVWRGRLSISNLLMSMSNLFVSMSNLLMSMSNLLIFISRNHIESEMKYGHDFTT